MSTYNPEETLQDLQDLESPHETSQFITDPIETGTIISPTLS